MTQRRSDKPLPSATVALVRQGRDGPELLLMLRRHNTSFADSHVFPGGLVERQDFDVVEQAASVDLASIDAELGVDNGLAYYSAAVRELFEEAGVLLARTARGDWADACELARYREPLQAGQHSWPRFLQRFGLAMACDALHYFAFWVTPRELEKRFSTRFFLAELPAGQTARHCGVELLDSRWMTAAAALEASRAGRIRLQRPTRASLKSLARFGDVESMRDWARHEGSRGVPRIRPAIVSVDGEQALVMPDDRRYPPYRTDDV